jgi:hypothetical protein
MLFDYVRSGKISSGGRLKQELLKLLQKSPMGKLDDASCYETKYVRVNGLLTNDPGELTDPDPHIPGLFKLRKTDPIPPWPNYIA